MDMTKAHKEHIDKLTYMGLLSRWKFARSGDPWMSGDTGTYWGDRMKELRSQEGGQEEHVRCSKKIGW